MKLSIYTHFINNLKHVIDYSGMQLWNLDVIILPSHVLR